MNQTTQEDAIAHSFEALQVHETFTATGNVSDLDK